ncbi:hypothetical protein GTA62_13560 [Roseobacter sp. HKCCD9010]|uniref:hypothetical protein n=1 Tax=unclassified Roseobacter TaxID=196798 RepID=UPI001491331A|nr:MULTISPECIES: hypothetical protein [unclassified Roseobacter]MBF9049788.1 hypothetical protein [Rhodobacterales bacterium HKCCD4356]NNV13673.1 hypothetical protein [Roseobacter sp. HKCCD7357]NNV16507.1 hypothetical protein [Roseobacter sp. HKCCD8768]NNV25966.1 hypothetical protein [Roseobacter sp. HKCCD8192]NNV30225.1 hypothetical protein [Roseobacter sp. HKCCD9061]
MKTAFAFVCLLLGSTAVGHAETAESLEDICEQAQQILDDQPRQVQDILNSLCGQYWDD